MQGLIGLVNERNGRVILHGVRHSLLEHQADAVGLPLRLVPLDWTAPVTEHNAALQRSFGELGAEGAERVAFGNLLSPGFMEHGRRATTGTRRVTVRPTRSITVYDFAFADLEPDPLPEVVADVGAAAATRPAEPEATRTSSSVPGANRRTLANATARAFDPFSYFARLERVRRHVDDHLAEDLDGAAIARVAAMSPTGFSRYFRQHVGMTFAVWLARRRVEHACRELRENNLAVSRIGETVGFHSERTFRRVFHEHMDCSPAQYRKRWLAQRQPPID